MRARIRSTSRTILATFLLFLLIVACLFGYLAWTEYRRARTATLELVSSRAQLVAGHAEWLVSAGLQTLDAADRLAGDRLASASHETVTNIAAIVKNLPGDANFSLVDPGGRVLIATDPAVTTANPLEIADILAQDANGKPYVSAMTARTATQNQVFMISRVLKRNGQNAGIATVYLPVSVMVSLWSTADLGPDSTIGLLRDDGWLVARYPAPNEPVNLANYVLFTDYLKRADHGTYDAESPVDNQLRVVGYRRVPNAPLVATASADQRFVMHPFWSYFTSIVAVFLGLLAICGLAIRWAWKLLREDEARKQQLAEISEQRALLLREIHHRVKNNLQAMASLINLQPMEPVAQRDMNSRIAAMSAVHEQSYLLDQFAELDLESYLHTLVRNTQQSVGSDIAITAQLTPMLINRDIALPLGLIVNEVIANARKHAFKDQADPQIGISLRWLNDSEAELTVQDNGKGYVPDREEKGMGFRLIKAFGQQLGGKYAFENSDGTVFRIVFAASHRA